MIPLEKIRTTEIKTGDGWVKVMFSQIEPGDIIRQFEPDGEPVVYKGRTEFTAKSHAVLEIIDDEEDEFTDEFTDELPS
jgi:hypothetical protein